MNRTLLNELGLRLIKIARMHGMKAYPECGAYDSGIVVEIPWTRYETSESGVFYEYVKTVSDLRKALGY